MTINEIRNFMEEHKKIKKIVTRVGSRINGVGSVDGFKDLLKYQIDQGFNPDEALMLQDDVLDKKIKSDCMRIEDDAFVLYFMPFRLFTGDIMNHLDMIANPKGN